MWVVERSVLPGFFSKAHLVIVLFLPSLACKVDD